MAYVSIKKTLGGDVESLHNKEGFSVDVDSDIKKAVANWTSETRDGSIICHFKMADQFF